MRQVYSACEEVACATVGVAGVESYYKNQFYLQRAKILAQKSLTNSIDTLHQVKDFPLLIKSSRQFLGEVDSEIAAELSKQKTRKTDLFECPRVIMKHANKIGGKGLYRKEFPASGLWMDFEAASRQSTRDLVWDLKLWDWDAMVES